MELIYKGLRGTLEHMEVSDSEVERQLKRLQEQTPRRIPVTDRPAQNGDEVVLDYAMASSLRAVPPKSSR
mgnify:CR=1 FL=1